jgi:hypothetical protein
MSFREFFENTLMNEDKKRTISTAFDYFIYLIWDSFGEALKELNLKKPLIAISHYQYEKLKPIYLKILNSKIKECNVIFDPSKNIIKNIPGFTDLQLTKYREDDVWFLIKRQQNSELKEVYWDKNQLTDYLKKNKKARIFLADKFGFYSEEISIEKMLKTLNPRSYDYGIGSQSSTHIERVKLRKDYDGNLYLDKWTEVWD